MAKRVIWSPLAKKQRREILEYWISHNRSKSYSRKLNSLFKGAQKLISLHPNIGVPTTDPNIRHKLVRDYSLFYELREDSIIILTVWDHRQDPKKLTFHGQVEKSPDTNYLLLSKNTNSDNLPLIRTQNTRAHSVTPNHACANSSQPIRHSALTISTLKRSPFLGRIRQPAI